MNFRWQATGARSADRRAIRRFGAMIVDATKPIKTIVDRMLTANGYRCFRSRVSVTVVDLQRG
jgi:hypothetical protein